MSGETRLADAEALADALAAHLARSLSAALKARTRAGLIVSGGKTPRALFDRLAEAALDWDRVLIGLADERWVAPDQDSSNERLVRRHLLRGRAAAAHFIGMKNAAGSPRAGASAAWVAYTAIPRPFDAVLLGMGDDGHTASLFPGSAGLAEALDRASPPGCVAMTAPVAPFERVSLNLPALLQSREILLCSTGQSKWQTYQRALAPGVEADMPIRAVLRQSIVPVAIYWSP